MIERRLLFVVPTIGSFPILPFLPNAVSGCGAYSPLVKQAGSSPKVPKDAEDIRLRDVLVAGLGPLAFGETLAILLCVGLELTKNINPARQPDFSQSVKIGDLAVQNREEELVINKDSPQPFGVNFGVVDPYQGLMHVQFATVQVDKSRPRTLVTSPTIPWGDRLSPKMSWGSSAKAVAISVTLLPLEIQELEVETGESHKVIVEATVVYAKGSSMAHSFTNETVKLHRTFRVRVHQSAPDQSRVRPPITNEDGS